MIGANFDKPQVHRNVLNTPISEIHTGVVLYKCAQERSVTRKKCDFSATHRSCDHLRCFSGEKHTLW
jgi:hypothetical protein